jgi:hypothetical protein
MSRASSRPICLNDRRTQQAFFGAGARNDGSRHDADRPKCSGPLQWVTTFARAGPQAIEERAFRGLFVRVKRLRNELSRERLNLHFVDCVCHKALPTCSSGVARRGHVDLPRLLYKCVVGSSPIHKRALAALAFEHFDHRLAKTAASAICAHSQDFLTRR